MDVDDMTKAAALHQFFSSFGLDAYAASAVPDDVVFPYLTYELITAAWGDSPVGITVNLWYYTDKEKIPNDKVNEISKAIGQGCRLQCDGGAISIYRGSPWSQSLTDATSPTIKRRYLNITAIYETLF
jgi:hypothetical protein